ncbi:leucine-rich repeat serine/threonine-protein kinase 1 isoform X2 [Hydra vulgaris]|uniref:non-specific serine/threonine protein kinase n=1 Tax=Hydra vulgaris TaxID=6087 RepID=A0ABM4BIG0_HYDVU
MKNSKTASDLGLVFSYEGEILHNLAVSNRVNELEREIIQGTNGDIKSVDKEGRTILHTAAKYGSVDCVKLLLKRGADPNASSGIEDRCSTPLHHAVANGNVNCVKALVEYDVNFDLKNSMGKKALDLAIESNAPEGLLCADIIRKVIAQKEKDAENAKSEALYDLVSAGDFSNTKHILETLKDPCSIINNYFRGHNTLLFRASFYGYKDIVQLLIDYQADGRPNAESGLTPLYAACYHGHYDVAVLLSKTFPKLLLIPLIYDLTYPLHACVMREQEHIVEYLLTLRKQPGLEVSNEFSSRSSFNRNDSENYYVEINKTTGNGLTCLHMAVMFGNLNIIQMFLGCKPFKKESEEEKFPGCLVIDKVYDTKTAFHLSLVVDKQNSLQCAEMLILNGADVNKPFEDGDHFCTPLQYVCRNEKVKFIKLLRKYNVEDINGEALNDAMANDKDEAVNELLSDGVIVNEDDLALAASEVGHNLNPVSISWKNRHIKCLKDKWVLNSVLIMNSNKDFLKNNISLQMKVITHINLSENCLEAIPVIIFQLPSLKKLSLSKNKLDNLPVSHEDEKIDPFINSINEDENNLSMNWNCPCLEELDLQYNLLKKIPKNVFEMPALQSLNCGNNLISSLPFDIWIAKSLKTLILDNNHLTNLPIFDENAKSRYHQTPRKNRNKEKLKDIDERIKKNAFATSKEFLFNKRPTWEGESDDSDEDEADILKKTGLNKLSLSNNKLTEIPKGLACLAPNLTKLILSHNKIAIVNCVYLFPEHLSYLELKGNTMKTFNLAEPENLGCYAFVKRQVNKRVSLPNESFFCQHRRHRQLNELCNLDLSQNCLENINLFVLNTLSMDPHAHSQTDVFCKNLKNLDISSNRLTSLPNGIGKLKKMESLVANQNQIISLPSELGLCSDIYALQVDNGSLKQLPKNITDDYERKKIKPLIRHLKSLHDKALPFPNIKLMLVGVHGIGKTTLLMSLRKKGSGNYQHADHKSHFTERIMEKDSHNKGGNKAKSCLSTVGVDVCDWEYGKKPIKFSTWDFGGQSEYYATHQCFLSQRAIYLLVCRLTDKSFGISHLESWLLNIQARAPNTTVLIVGTHADEIDRSSRENFKNVIKEKFILIKNGENKVNAQDIGLPRVEDVIDVSCTKDDNIQELRDLIYRTAMNIKGHGKEAEYKLLDQPIPASYIAVEKAVSAIVLEMKDTIPVLNAEDFRSKVYEQLIIQKTELKNGNEELNQAVRFLHDYGTLLHFDDPNLSDLYFINPQWLCDMLAHIITVKSVNPCIKNGLLKISDLKNQIFRGDCLFPSSMIPKYVELLNKFDVAIKIQHKYLLIPSGLPEKQKECIIVAENQSSLLKNPMNLSACLKNIFRRQYLLTYIPSGLWARLLTRMIADDRIRDIVLLCCDIQGSNVTDSRQAQDEKEILKKAAPPEWACWKTGIELSCFGIKLLRVGQLDPEVPFYGSNTTLSCVFVKNPVVDFSRRVAIEITAPCITLIIDKFVLNKNQYSELQDEQMVGFRVKSVHYNSQLNACKLLVLTIEHIDTLLAEWYSQLDRFVDPRGLKAVRRVSFCSKCIENGVLNNTSRDFLNSTSTDFFGDLGEDEISQLKLIRTSKKNCIVAFELEQGSKYLNEKKDLVCPIHDVIDIKATFPDLYFLDVDPGYVLNNCKINPIKIIGKGGFGDVFVAEIKHGNSTVLSAMKVPGGSVKESNQVLMATMLSYDAYKSIRQEVSIILTLRHEHIVKFLGVTSNPFALFLELALKGALSNCLNDFSSAGKRLAIYTVVESLKQVSSALKYLHKEGIIYRDLKCDNILARKFPDPFNESPSTSQVHLLLTDYGISRTVFIGGTKGLQGTVGYMAPEISKYSGKEIYSEKVDCFSFGSFIYELLSLHRPFNNISNMHIVKQNVIDGKRPKLTKMERKYPALILSLMYRCWSHNPEDRPSASEINSLTSLNEFQSLLDILGLGKHFDLQCIVTSSEDISNHNVISSRSQIGSYVWFCGSLNNRPEGVVTVFTYNDFKYNHILNLQLKEKVLVACSVGSSMWFGTEVGSIKVYGATSLKLIAIGSCLHNGHIHTIEHYPIFNCVIVLFSNNTIFYFSDALDSYQYIKTPGDDTSSSHPNTKLRELIPSKQFSFDYSIYSIAIVHSNYSLNQSCASEGVTLPTNSCSTEVYELWFGQEKGQITILNAKTMARIQIISVKKNELERTVQQDLTVTFLETSRSYDSFTEAKKDSCHIWIVTYPGTQVEKWNVDTRQVEEVFDASQHVVSLTLNCSKTSKKAKITKACDAQIQSLVVAENKMYVGTSSGSFFICDAQTMIPHTWLKCYKELISFITPFRMKTGANEESEEKLILTCGQNCLDQWSRKVDCINYTSSKEMTVLTWNTKKL